MKLGGIFFYSFIAGVFTLIGSGLILLLEKWTRKNTVYLISFASGVMIGVTFNHLIPEALHLNYGALKFVLLGFLIFYLLQNLIMFHVCREERCEFHHITPLSLIGLLAHSFIDGVAISVGFEIDHKLGILTAIAVAFHEAPEGISITSILLHSNYKKVSALFYSLLVALATPLGAISSYFFLRNISTEMFGTILAVIAGSFIYVTASDLIPETHRFYKFGNVFYFFLGILVIYASELIFH